MAQQVKKNTNSSVKNEEVENNDIIEEKDSIIENLKKSNNEKDKEIEGLKNEFNDLKSKFELLLASGNMFSNSNSNNDSEDIQVGYRGVKKGGYLWEIIKILTW